MAVQTKAWWSDNQLWVEAFVTANIAFLTLDIYLAHSVNQFRSRAEFIPLALSAVSPLILLPALFARKSHPWAWRYLGYLVGWTAVFVGLTGVILHLESHFFLERTLRSLTYSAPFAAPLAYVGLGFLLIMNRMVDCQSMEWAHWVLLFTLGGYFGNFIFSLTDHAENGFFNPIEWIAVGASAFAVGFLIVPLVIRVSKRFIDVCGVVLLGEALVGVWGFLLHSLSNLRGPSVHAYDNFIYGAPPLAPLLFPNLMVLGLIGLWRLRNSENLEPLAVATTQERPSYQTPG